MTTTDTNPKFRIFSASFLSLFLLWSYFYHLLREEFNFMVRKQAALESMKIIAVPGTEFLNKIGSLEIAKSALFYLALLGMLFIVFMLFSLLFKSPIKRAVFLLLGLLATILLTFHDRINISFPFIIFLSFTAFYLLTLSSYIHFSIKELLFTILLLALISGSLVYGGKNKFFMKARDKILFDTSIGNKLITFYYSSSPLAASLITPKLGIYEGLIFHEDFKDKNPVYLGKGLFLTGNKEVKGDADFIVSKKDGKLFIESRYGIKKFLQPDDFRKLTTSVKELSRMNGILKLNRAGLFFLPAGLFLICLLLIRRLTANPKIFGVSCSVIAVFILFFTWYISLTGNSPPKGEDIKNARLSSDGLSVAYYLYKKKEVPEPYISFVKMMPSSESQALRYWGAYHLGMLGDKGEARTLIKLMKDSSFNVRYRAAQSLYRLLKKESFGPLYGMLTSDPNWYVRCKIFLLFLKAGMIPSPA